MEGEAKGSLLKWYLGQFAMPPREEGVLEEEASLVEELMTREGHWTPKEARKMVRATKPLEEHAGQKRGEPQGKN